MQPIALDRAGIVRHATGLSSLIAASASLSTRALSLLARRSSRLRNARRAPTAVLTRQNFHDRSSSHLAPGGQPCEVCFPRPRPSADTEASRCGGISEGERVRAWITAHNADKCCGHRHRTLVLCFDGTGEMFDEDSSNVVRFCSMLKKDDNSRQLIHYQSGVGTYIDPVGYRHTMPLNLNLALDKAFAWSLSSHVKDGYAFLMQNYTEGDKVCIFGFSRGAYIARALAGMIQKVGLLPIYNDRQIPAAYDLYLRQDDAGIDLCYDFKTKFARGVSIEFLGLWDTVASVGMRPKQLPFIFENTGVRTLRQALALDERRAKFVPQFCYDPPKEDDLDERAYMGKAYMDLVDDAGRAPDVQEVWFAGVHTDVGGGAIKDNRLITPSLARIPLRWMIRECFQANTGIVFDAHMLQAVGLPVSREIRAGPNGEQLTMYKLDPPYEWSPMPSSDSPHDAPPLEKHSIIFDGLVTFSRAIRRSSARILKRITQEIMPKRWPFSMLMVRPAKRKREREQYGWRELSPEYEYAEEMKDMRTEIHCQLAEKPLWMVLELIPLRIEQQTALVHKMRHGKSYRTLWNRGRGRRIFQTGVVVKVHRTVKMRVENDPTYIPQARPEMEVRYLHDRDPDKYIHANRLSRYEWNESNPTAWTWFPSVPKSTAPSN